MPNNIKKNLNGIGIIPTSSLASDTMGELEVNASGGKLNYYDGSVRSPVVTEASTASLTNKTINGNTITSGTGTLTLSTYTLTVANTASVSGTNTGDQTITLTGDVTGTGTGSFATTLAATSNSTLTTLSGLTSASSLATVGTITSGTWNGTTLAINHGGTGQTSAGNAFNALAPSTAKGGITAGTGSNTYGNLTVGADGKVLTADSTQTTGLNWTSPLTNPMTTLGDIIYENASPAVARLAGNTTTTNKFLTQVGNGSVSAAPGWNTISTTDLPAGPINPPGAVIMYAGSSAPTGYLLCDGSAVSRTTYATLFSIISTTYGVGDGSTTFNVPNTKGVFVRGAGSQTISSLTYTGTLGSLQNDTTKKNGMATSNTLGISNTLSVNNGTLGIFDPGHAHTLPATDISGGGSGTTYPSNSLGTTSTSTNTTGITLSGNVGMSGSVSLTGGVTLTGGDAETRPANLALNYIIKY